MYNKIHFTASSKAFNQLIILFNQLIIFDKVYIVKRLI